MNTCNPDNKQQLRQLLACYHLEIIDIDADQPIPGSYWGEPEAGIIGHRLYLREDTPLHSALHEACHYICMNEARRAVLDTDTGGDYDEENAVCYLQILLARQMDGVSLDDICGDMDEWGYTFRLGSALKWFEEDADDARQWLVRHGIIDRVQKPTGNLRLQAA